MEKQSNLISTVLAVMFLLAVSGLVFSQSHNLKLLAELNNKQPNDVPLMFFTFDGWGENYYNSNEYLLSGFIYNLGNQEAKNVKVLCGISNDNKIKSKEIFEIGSVASNTITYQQFNIKKEFAESDEDIGTCIYYESDNGFDLGSELKDIKDLREKYG